MIDLIIRLLEFTSYELIKIDNQHYNFSITFDETAKKSMINLYTEKYSSSGNKISSRLSRL